MTEVTKLDDERFYGFVRNFTKCSPDRSIFLIFLAICFKSTPSTLSLRPAVSCRSFRVQKIVF